MVILLSLKTSCVSFYLGIIHKKDDWIVFARPISFSLFMMCNATVLVLFFLSLSLKDKLKRIKVSHLPGNLGWKMH